MITGINIEYEVNAQAWNVTHYARIAGATYSTNHRVVDMNEMQKATDDALCAFAVLAQKVAQAEPASKTVH
jgi:hypothetical protein